MIRYLTLHSLFSAIFACAMCALLPAPAKSETIPLPTIDYEAKANLLNDGTLHIRHGKGKMRVEMKMPQLDTPAVGFIDLNRKVMIMALPIPGVQDTAVEIAFGDDAAFGQVIGEGSRAGNDTVAGERCTLWQIKSPSGEGSATACLTSDNIALRTQVVIGGKSTTVFEVTELKRQPQNAQDLEAPANLNVIKVPKGIKGIPGFPRL
jgi:hypothetical protein